MTNKQRNFFIKKLWERYSPYIQIAGYFPIFGGVATGIWMLFSFGVSQTEAFMGLKDKLIEQHDAIIQIQQEVHDIHGWVKP